MTSLFSSLLGAMGATSKLEAALEVTRAGSSDSTITEVSVDMNSNAQSASSTPPTSIGDSVSISSASSHLEKIQSIPAAESAGRSRRQRTSVGTYNVKVLSGTAIHAPRKYLKSKSETGNELRRKTISGETLTETLTSAAKSTNEMVSEDIDALNLEWPVRVPTKLRRQLDRGSPKKNRKTIDIGRGKITYTASLPKETHNKRLSVLGKRRRQTLDDNLSSFIKVKRELRNLADTNEFAKIDTKPVIHEVWSNGKLVVPTAPAPKAKASRLASKLAPVEKALESKPAEPNSDNRKKEKIWLPMGLYAAQEPLENLNWFKLWSGPKDHELPPFKPEGTLPLPMWHGQRLLYNGRDFKLPFDVCAPLPPGQPKPDEWHKTSSNRFVGDAGALWKKSSLFDSFSSKCVCTPEGGCDEDCQNRIMLYECDDTNCASGRDICTNRAFAQLQERRKGGGKYRIGVEVIKTSDRGYGVRSNRCFDPHQIIVEYTGEIITEDECDRRMNEDYKDNKCYYLMSFDQQMIIDATKGSIARFVNHSCRPNCRMVKWIVGGKPRMALFAGDRPIMSGDELTYDYNFDPFSAKNVQECLCGSDNCRGVLGPKPKDPKPVKEALKEAVKATVKAGKRKLQQFLGTNDEDKPTPKKRKMKTATGVRRTSTSIKSVQNPTLKKIVSAKSLRIHQKVRSTPKKSRKSATIAYSRVTSSTFKKKIETERKSPRSKSRRSYREFLEEDEEEEKEFAVRTSGRKRRSTYKEEADTIRVFTDDDD